MAETAISGIGAFIYCISTHRYLFLLRNSKKYDRTWGVAGGKCEKGEYLLDSLYRELEEELGYDFSETKVIPIEKFTAESGHFSYSTCLIPVQNEFVPRLNDEHRGWCWVLLDDHPRPLHPGVSRSITYKEVVTKIKLLETVL